MPTEVKMVIGRIVLTFFGPAWYWGFSFLFCMRHVIFGFSHSLFSVVIFFPHPFIELRGLVSSGLVWMRQRVVVWRFVV